MTVTANTDLTALSLEQINWLIDESSNPSLQAITSSYVGLNASDEYQYEITHNSLNINAVVSNHAFVDLDLQGDPRIQMNDIQTGDLNLRQEVDVSNGPEA